jgi:selenoprotein W-related protein|tara:strand:+ start:3691 stop:3885 length:195 start_codon:yes stop_codon:yes gene_type:complete
VSTVKDLLTNHQQVIEDVRLVPGGSGIFDVTVNDELIYSKHETGRHADNGEISTLFQKKISKEI